MNTWRPLCCFVPLLLWLGILSPANAAPLAAVPLAGPYKAFEDFVAELQRDGSYAQEALTVTTRTEHAAVLTLTGSGRASSFLAIAGPRGWLVDRVLGDVYHPAADKGWVLHDNLRNTYYIVDLTEHSAWVVLRAISAPYFRYGKELAKDAYYCVGIEVVCRLDSLVCSPPFAVAGKAACQPTSVADRESAASRQPAARRWNSQTWNDWSKLDWYHPLTLGADGTITVPTAKPPQVPRALGDDFAKQLVIPPGTYPLR